MPRGTADQPARRPAATGSTANANQAKIQAESQQQAAQQSIDRAKAVVNDPKRATP